MRIIDYLYGEMTLAFDDRSSHTLVFDILRKSGANYRRLSLLQDVLTLQIPKTDARRLMSHLDALSISYRIEREAGLYLLLRRLKRRPGLWLGAFLFIALLFASTHFVFDIRITGNEMLTDAEILEELEENGFICGSYLPNIDMEALCNRVVLRSDRIAWISVNMLGTVAHVEVKERKETDSGTDKGGLSCLVAERDGVIVGFDCSSGTIAVNVGETVKKGQVLVNGILETQGGAYFQSAAGRVRARTNRTLTFTVNKSEEVTVGYRRVLLEKYIIFLGKSIKVFAKGGNLPQSCDTIREETVQLSLYRDLMLPIYEKKVYLEIPITERVSYTEEQAQRIAAEEIASQMAKIDGLSVLESEVIFTEDDHSYTMTRTITCIENIAKVVPIKTN
ncbi:MAG: hypothetical protein E7599_05625 [Ruminococcaceae bacterium]|nr:hypothetical protein [Oscillospiraceae bacterium]